MPSNEPRFYREAEACIGQILEENPATATFLGDHRFDERLADFTAEGIKRQRAMLGSWQRKMAQFDPKTMPLDARIDHALTTRVLGQFVRGFDEIRGVERDPGAAPSEVMQGVYFLVLHDFAPLPERMKSILARLRASPKTLADGRARIVPKDVPPVWAQIALESTKQSVGFFAAFLPRLAKGRSRLLRPTSPRPPRLRRRPSKSTRRGSRRRCSLRPRATLPWERRSSTRSSARTTWSTTTPTPSSRPAGASWKRQETRWPWWRGSSIPRER
jgi:hypothetical protein